MARNTYKPSPKAKAKKVKEKPKERRNRFAFLKDQRLHLAVGFFLIVASLYLMTAFMAYLFTGQVDQSVVESVLESNIKAAGMETENWLGLVGAVSAYFFIFRWFGIASFLIPPFLFIAGYKIVFRRALLSTYRTFKFTLFFLVWTSLVFGYLTYHQEALADYTFLGGGIGYEIATMLVSLIGWGTLLLLAFALIVFVIYFFNITSLFKHKPKAVSTSAKNDRYLPNDTPVVSSPAKAESTKQPAAEEETGNAYEMDFTVVQNTPEKSAKKDKKEETTRELSLDIAPTVAEPDLHATNNVEDGIQDAPDLVIEENATEKKAMKTENYDPTLDLPRYRYPEPGLLHKYDSNKVQVTKEELESNKDRIVETLINFKIGISSIKATIGPTVTLYEIVPEAGVKISKIKNLEDDIALSLSALGIRIIAPIPGKGTIGIEVPNKNREVVSMYSVITTEKFMRSNKELPIILGKTVSNELYVSDLAKMPHILIAGATGQGKSVGLNVLLTSLIYRKHPSQLKLVLVDPKKVELSLFNKIERHFLAKLPDSEEAIITDTKKVIHTLNSLCIEMDHRYNLLKDAGTRNIKEYNQKFISRKLNPNEGHRFLPYIVLVIDELADLMMTAGKEVETPIARLAQLARAIGIHLVVATQRPSVNVITGIIKANFPVRLSFRVTSKVDSRTILDSGGAEQLVGMGDMLLSVNSEQIRLQCPYIDTPEVENICEYIGSQRGYDSAYLLPEFVGEESDSSDVTEVDLKNRDALFDDAARLIVHHQQGSTSLIQRKMKLGYNRAGRIIDQLEAAGIVGPFEGSKAREVLVTDEYSLEQLLNNLNN